jgi:hypothetical protein
MNAGRLFIWGKCSRNDSESEILTPKPVPHFFNVKVKLVACGSRFSAVLTGLFAQSLIFVT